MSFDTEYRSELNRGTRACFPFSLFLVKIEMEGNTWCAVSAHEILM